MFCLLIYLSVNSLTKKWLNRGERRDIYLKHVCRLLLSTEILENIEILEFSASTMAFISCRLKFEVMPAGATSGGEGIIDQLRMIMQGSG